MKKLAIYFVQESCGFSYRLELTSGKFLSQKDVEKFLFGALGKFFNFVGTLKFCKGKGVNLSKPFNFIIVTGDDEKIVYDGLSVREELTATLKLQNTCKSRKRFAQKALELTRFAAMELKFQTLEELFEQIGE